MLELDVKWKRGGFELRVACQLHERATAIFGPSGAGKSSLLQLINGLHEPQTGRIVLGERVLFDSRRDVFVPPERRRIGMLFQDDRLFPHLNVAGNLRYGSRWLGKPSQRIQFDDVLDVLEIAALQPRNIRDLSGGERQRVALGRALLMSPDLLLLDEPLSALDRRLKLQILPFLRRVQEHFKIPLVYVSHDLDEILQLTRHLAVLESGRLLACGPFQDVLREPRVLSVARQLGLDNVLHVSVQEHLVEEQLTRLQVVGRSCTFLAPRTVAATGAQLFAAIGSDDIALATQPHAGLSIQNQLPGRVTRLQEQDGKVLVEVDVGCVLFLEVSRRAVSELGLAVGRPAHCLFKALCVRYLSEQR